MKIKNWLILSYITVMLIPILTAVILFFWMESYNKQTEINDYVTNMRKFQKYEEVLNDENIFLHPPKKLNLIDEKDKSNTKIELYDKNGILVYSSNNETMSIPTSTEQLYKELYEIKHGFRADTFKKPIFSKGDLIGVYKITIMRTKIVKGVNDITLKALAIFITVFFLVLISMIKLMNKKFNNPILLLIAAMKDFAKGKETSIKYKSQDEIGELIKHFNNMKSELEQKNAEIEKEQKSKEYMIAAISHDLKTPLTAIRAYAELISSKDEESSTRHVSSILNKCDYMTNMLEDLLMYTVLSSNYAMNLVNVDGEEFFQMLFSGYNEVCSKNNIRFKTEIKVNGSFCVDVKQMIRVIDNLMSNAIRYTEEGKWIHMGVFSHEFNLPNWICQDEKQKLKEFAKEGAIILVKNEGEEISKEHIERIMEPFYKVDNSRNKKVGTGLGLSIVKLIIDKHHGKMTILSSKETGTLIACFLKNEGMD